jgi:hypothetical protein
MQDVNEAKTCQGQRLPEKSGALWILQLTLFTIRAAHEFWLSMGSYGDAKLYANLHTDSLEISQDARSFHSLFYNEELNILLDRNAISLTSTPGIIAAAALHTNFYSRSENLHETVGVVLNQLMRGLGHSVHLTPIQESIRTTIAQANLLRGF